MSGLLWAEIPKTSTRKGDLVATERANQITHGLATLLALVAAVVVVRSAILRNGGLVLIAGCCTYGVTQFLVYLCSTLSHSFLSGYRKHLFRTLDQISIFLMIAGGYTPLGLTICSDSGGGVVLAVMWLLALAGIATKLFVRGIQNVPVWFYVAIGWLPLLNLPPILNLFPTEGLYWILAGGVCYTIGTYFLLNDSKGRYYHPTWHVLVMLGSGCHFVVIYRFLIPGLTV
ncbi:hypothetical protein GC176_08430 [bacterium]|nr:hypothetical protein [bacterium]